MPVPCSGKNKQQQQQQSVAHTRRRRVFYITMVYSSINGGWMEVTRISFIKAGCNWTHWCRQRPNTVTNNIEHGLDNNAVIKILLSLLT